MGCCGSDGATNPGAERDRDSPFVFFTRPAGRDYRHQRQKYDDDIDRRNAESARQKIFLGGNLGAPFIGATTEDWDWGVTEISSFQLEWVEEFRPQHRVIAQYYGRPFGSLCDLCRLLLPPRNANIRGADLSATSRSSIAMIPSSGRYANGCGLGCLFRFQ
jgi:hypothetical protein